MNNCVFVQILKCNKKLCSLTIWVLAWGSHGQTRKLTFFPIVHSKLVYGFYCILSVPLKVLSKLEKAYMSPE